MTPRGIWPAATLFLLAPFVGELLLGNLKLDELGVAPLLAPLYGGGALLVRELGRRTGGWPTMFMLAGAYALLEEGPIDQLLWNDSYAGHDLLHGPSFVPALGMSISLTQTILALHVIWSICVPIALVESLAPTQATTLWLGRRGLVGIGIVYAVGGLLVFLGNYSEERFIASPAQLIGCSLAIVALVLCAFLLPRRLRRLDARAPSPALVGVLALLATSAYWGPSTILDAATFEWTGVAIWCLLFGVGGLLVSRWSRSVGWGRVHRYALAAGATLTYVWTAFALEPESGGSDRVDLIGNICFGAIALLILLIAYRNLTHAGAQARCAQVP